MVKHPAKFSKELFPIFERYVAPGMLILDPFAGVGGVHLLPGTTVGLEIEPEWAAQTSGRTVVGNALALPFPNGVFDAVVTSPTYGNRLADKHNAKDGSIRRSYTHDLGRRLHHQNSGGMQWGPEYRLFHRKVWREVYRVLGSGLLLINSSNHIRKGKEVQVTEWHAGVLASLGFRLVREHRVPTPRLRFGQNATARVEYETVSVWRS